MKRKEGIPITSLLISPCPESKFLGRTLTLLRGLRKYKMDQIRMYVYMYIQVHVVYIHRTSDDKLPSFRTIVSPNYGVHTCSWIYI